MAQKLRRDKYGRLSAEQLTAWKNQLVMAIEDYDDRPMKKNMATLTLVHLCKTAMLPLLKELLLYRKVCDEMGTALWPDQSTTKSD